jgi:signal transduction histidine kinase
LSLVYTAFTEAALFFGIYLVYNILNYDNELAKKQAENILNNINNTYNNEAITNNYTMNGLSNDLLSRADTPNKGVIIAIAAIASIVGVVLFTTYFLLLTRKFASYIEEIASGITKIAAGDFETRIDINNEDEFAFIATKLNNMTDDIKQIIENDRKSESNKNELITSVAHDLRTPLTSIIGYLELVSDQDKISPETKQRYIEIAYSKSKRLEKLIEDLFAYTKFSFGEATMELSDIDMVKFISQLVDEFYPSFAENGLEYEFNTNLNSVYVSADGNLLARAFANLVSNAIKYGKDGKRVIIKLIEEHGKVKVSVTNYGRLIPEKDLNYIFERFYRVESSRSSETGGTGLGLAIAKSIIEMHGGSIRVKSDFDGTVFEVAMDMKKEG